MSTPEDNAYVTRRLDSQYAAWYSRLVRTGVLEPFSYRVPRDYRQPSDWEENEPPT